MLKPINNHVLVEPVKEEEKKSAGGIIIPDVKSKESRSRLDRGIVIAVEAELPVKAGEVVYYRKGVGLEVLGEDSKVYLVIPVTQLQLVAEKV